MPAFDASIGNWQACRRYNMHLLSLYGSLRYPHNRDKSGAHQLLLSFGLGIRVLTDPRAYLRILLRKGESVYSCHAIAERIEALRCHVMGLLQSMMPTLAPRQISSEIASSCAALMPVRQSEGRLSSYKPNVGAAAPLQAQIARPKALLEANIFAFARFINVPAATYLRQPRTSRTTADRSYVLSPACDDIARPAENSAEDFFECSSKPGESQPQDQHEPQLL